MDPHDELNAALGLGPPDQSENICNFEIYPQALGKLYSAVLGILWLLNYFHKYVLVCSHRQCQIRRIKN